MLANITSTLEARLFREATTREDQARREEEAAIKGRLARIDAHFRKSPLSKHPWLEMSQGAHSTLSQTVQTIGLALLVLTIGAGTLHLLQKSAPNLAETLMDAEAGRAKW